MVSHPHITRPNGYLESIDKGIKGIKMLSGSFSHGMASGNKNLLKLRSEIDKSDAIIIGAGSGLSTSAGFTYTGERFKLWFADFEEKYGFHDMYQGGFYPYKTHEEFWAYWARYIYINRYMDMPETTYSDLLRLVKDKDYFVITTNVDHCFQRAGFDKKRLFYTQGDYGLFQSVNPVIKETFDNESWVMTAMESMGYVKNSSGVFELPKGRKPLMSIPQSLIPKCSVDGSNMTTNLRADDSFVEDCGWMKASSNYSDFLHRHEGLHVLLLELGVGSNTPIIIKYPFWQMTLTNKKAFYACINYGESFCPVEIQDRSICIDDDIKKVLNKL